MHKILVTGAAGFIGSHLSRTLGARGYKVVAIDGLLESTYSREIKIQRFRELSNQLNIETSIRDLATDNLDELLDGVSIIINLAAMPGLNTSWTRFPEYLDCNVTLVQKIITSIFNKQIRFIQISTSSVYGKYAIGNESIPLNPISPYGVTKLAAENLVKAYGAEFNLDYVILRYFSVYGPGQRPEMAYAKFISDIDQGKEISIFGDGTQSRTNTYITDCVEATISAITKGKRKGIYNICGKDSISLFDSIQIISEELGVAPKITYAEKIKGDQFDTNGDITLAQKELNFEPKIRLREGLRNQVEAYKKGSFF
jgi:UDP-glucuronate 4-epimerase